MSRLWISLALLCFGMQLAVAQERIDARGEWRHPSADFQFPERVGEFSRFEITRYAKDHSDVSVAYGIRTPDGKITITLFVYTNGSDSPKSESDLRIHFAAMKVQVGRAFGGAVKTIPMSEVNWPHWLIAGVEVSTEETQPFRSVLLLQTCGKWYTKVRASFSSEMAQRFESEGRAVVQLITCPTDT